MTQLAHTNIWYKTLKVGRGSPRLPVRFYVEVGSLEDYPAPDHPSQLIANRDLRNVLKEKGYAIRYVEFDGRHEFVNWEALFPEALTFLLGARNAKRGMPSVSFNNTCALSTISKLRFYSGRYL